MFRYADHLGEPVEVYLDFHTPFRWIINAHRAAYRKNGAVRLGEGQRLNGMANEKRLEGNLTRELALQDCTFRIDETIRIRCQEEGGIPGAAWVQGKMAMFEDVRIDEDGNSDGDVLAVNIGGRGLIDVERVRWTRDSPHFFWAATGEPIEFAPVVYFRIVKLKHPITCKKPGKKRATIQKESGYMFAPPNKDGHRR